MATDYTGQKHPLAVQRLRTSIYAIGPSKKYCELYKMYEVPAKNNGVIFMHVNRDWMLFIVNAENHIALSERIKQTKELIESKGGITDIYTLLLCEKDLYPLRII